jgi:hypothetical protein
MGIAFSEDGERFTIDGNTHVYWAFAISVWASAIDVKHQSESCS